MIRQLIANGLIAGSVYAAIALGFAVIYNSVRFFHFAHGVGYTVGAYLSYTLVRLCGAPPAVALLVVTGGVLVAGVVMEMVVYRPMRRHKAPTLVFLIASFGILVFIQNLLQLLYGARILTIRDGFVREGWQVLGAVITDVQVLILTVAVLFYVGLSAFMRWTRLGKAMRAVADDRIGASVVGIDPERVILAAFAIGSGLAGAAGMLIAYETNIEPTMGMNAILKGIIASIVGGIGSIPGAALGGLFLGLAENIGIWKISAGWKDCIAFVILIVFLLIRPGGIMGVQVRREQL